MHNIGHIARITFLDGVRNRVLFGVLLMALLLFATALFVIPLFAFDHGKVAIDLGFSFLSIAGLSIIFFLAIPLISQDIYHRTVTLILSRPISRSHYILGKYAGLALTIAAAFLMIGALAGAFFWAGFHYIPHLVPVRDLGGGMLAIVLLLAYLSLLMVLAGAFLFTALTTSYYVAMLLTLAFYVTGHSLETIVRIVRAGDFFQATPAYQKALAVITWLFPNLRAFDIKVHLAYGLPVSWSYVALTTLYGLVYIGILLALSVWLFERKELQ